MPMDSISLAAAYAAVRKLEVDIHRLLTDFYTETEDLIEIKGVEVTFVHVMGEKDVPYVHVEAVI